MITKVQQSPSFQAIRVPGSDMPAVIQTAVKESKALQRFGKNYNADVNYTVLASSRNTQKAHPALIISDVKPIGILRKLVDKFQNGKNKKQFLYLSTRGYKDEDLAQKLKSVSSKYVLEKYKKATKS